MKVENFATCGENTCQNNNFSGYLLQSFKLGTRHHLLLPASCAHAQIEETMQKDVHSRDINSSLRKPLTCWTNQRRLGSYIILIRCHHTHPVNCKQCISKSDVSALPWFLAIAQPKTKIMFRFGMLFVGTMLHNTLSFLDKFKVLDFIGIYY